MNPRPSLDTAISPTISSVADARTRSAWLDLMPSVDDPITAASLPHRSELVIIGAGLTGLWAAFAAAAEGTDVLVVDSQTIGGGATGRCGGFINASITHGIAHGHALWPEEMPAIIALQEALWEDTISLLADAGFGEVIQPHGKITVATTAHHAAGLAESAALLRRYGQTVHELDADAMRAVANSSTYLAGYHHLTANGLCDPVLLAQAVAHLARDAGARIEEHHHVASIDEERNGIRVRFADGRQISADRVLLATNAFPPLQRRLRSRVIPVYDHVIATEPLDSARRSAIGWDRPIGITDAGNQFHYYRLMPDGRLLFGGWDATYHFGGRVDERLERRDETHQLLARHLLETFPALDGVTITHRWGGPIDSTSRFTPMFGTAMSDRLSWAVGFTGLGVGASRFAALAALDVLAGRSTDRSRLRMVRRQPIPFPPEPLRWPVIWWTKRALADEDRTGRRGLWLRLLDRLGVGFNT